MQSVVLACDIPSGSPPSSTQFLFAQKALSFKGNVGRQHSNLCQTGSRRPAAGEIPVAGSQEQCLHMAFRPHGGVAPPMAAHGDRVDL